MSLGDFAVGVVNDLERARASWFESYLEEAAEKGMEVPGEFMLVVHEQDRGRVDLTWRGEVVMRTWIEHAEGKVSIRGERLG